MARSYPNRHPPTHTPCLLSVFPLLFIGTQGQLFPSWDHPQVKQKLKGATGLRMLPNRLGGAHLARIPARKAEPLPEGAQPGEEVEGTEARASVPLAFGQHPVLDLGGPGTEGGGTRTPGAGQSWEGEGSSQPRES